jgi:hypothetical protein
MLQDACTNWIGSVSQSTIPGLLELLERDLNNFSALEQSREDGIPLVLSFDLWSIRYPKAVSETQKIPLGHL